MYRWKNVKLATRVLHSRCPMEALRSLSALEEAAKYPFPRAEGTAFDEAMTNQMLSDLETVREEPGQLEGEQRRTNVGSLLERSRTKHESVRSR